MSDEEPRPVETPEPAPSPPPGLGILFLAAALALALVLSFVALVAYMAFSPRKSVNPPPQPAPTKAAPEGYLLRHGGTFDRRT
jgi:hypothetical protein